MSANPTMLMTANEAASVTGVPLRQVHRIIDAGLLGVSTVTVSANAQTARNCHIREGEGGVLMNADTQAPFGYKDACIELNPHAGGNPATAEAARKAVSDFLQVLFKLS